MSARDFAPVREIVECAVHLVHREAPNAHARFVRLIPGSVALVVDGERVVLRRCDDVAVVDGTEDLVSVTIETDRSSIDDLVAGRLRLVDAIVQELVRVRGDVHDLASAHDAFVALVAGLVRCRRAQLLQRRLLGSERRVA